MAQMVRVANLTTAGRRFEDVVDVSYSSNYWLTAFCGISMIDSLNDFDRDNAVAIDIAYYDGNSNSRSPWVYGGDHWGNSGAFSNYHLPATIRFGRAVRFRLRSFHPDDIESAGFGVLWSYLS
jgi:hypothetical protein